MLTVLALLAAAPLAPSQPAALDLSGAHLTHGILGPVRADRQVYPGDSLFVAFDIVGLTVDPAGKASYAIELELTDAAGKPVFKPNPRDQESILALGGNRLPAFARFDLSQDQKPGDYTLKVTVTDKPSKQPKSFSEKFTVLPRGFALVAVSISADPEGAVPAGLLGTGQVVYVNAAIINFVRGTNQQPKVSVSLAITEAGKPTLAQPFSGTFDSGVPANAGALPAQFALSLNRPGKFTLEVKATDEVAKKTATLTFEITVLPAR
jgi:hypothetical protein